MFRNTAFLLLGLGLIVLQTNLFRMIGWLVRSFEEVAQVGTVAGLTPSLLLPLIVFMGVHEYSMVRGAMLSLALGYFFDVLAAAPIGLFSFTSVAVFVVSRVAGVRLAAQTLPTRIALAFVFSLVEGVIVVILTALFGGDAVRSRALATMVLPSAVVTAIAAPFVFNLAQRVHATTMTAPRPGEVGGR